MTSFSEHRLPRGRHRLCPEFVDANQRWRLIGAAVEIFDEGGYGAVTARLVVSRAAVSSTTFYRHFESVPHLMAACFDVAAGSLLEIVAQACQPSLARRQRLEAIFEEVLSFAENEPRLVHFLKLEAAAAAIEIAIGRERMIERLTVLCDGGETLSRESHAAIAAALGFAIGCTRSAASLTEVLELLSNMEAEDRH